jgi:hypothetical protein
MGALLSQCQRLLFLPCLALIFWHIVGIYIFSERMNEAEKGEDYLIIICLLNTKLNDGMSYL